MLVRPSLHPFFHPSVYQSIRLSVYPSISLSVYQSIRLSVYPSILLFVHQRTLLDAEMTLATVQILRLRRFCLKGEPSRTILKGNHYGKQPSRTPPSGAILGDNPLRVGFYGLWLWPRAGCVVFERVSIAVFLNHYFPVFVWGFYFFFLVTWITKGFRRVFKGFKGFRGFPRICQGVVNLCLFRGPISLNSGWLDESYCLFFSWYWYQLFYVFFLLSTIIRLWLALQSGCIPDARLDRSGSGPAQSSAKW